MGGIIICEYCNKYECPPPCPGFRGRRSALGTRLGFCTRCEGDVYEDDGHIKYENRYLCRECGKELVSDELLDFIGCVDIGEFVKLIR